MLEEAPFELIKTLFQVYFKVSLIQVLVKVRKKKNNNHNLKIIHHNTMGTRNHVFKIFLKMY